MTPPHFRPLAGRFAPLSALLLHALTLALAFSVLMDRSVQANEFQLAIRSRSPMRRLSPRA